MLFIARPPFVGKFTRGTLAARRCLLATWEYLLATQEYFVATLQYSVATEEYSVATLQYFVPTWEYLLATLHSSGDWREWAGHSLPKTLATLQK
jgi:hypothetical protein